MMLLSFSLNPSTLFRWLFFGKALSEIVADFEKKKNELESFFTRTERRVARKAIIMETLASQNASHQADMAQARLVAQNLTVLMTQTLGTPAAEPKPTDEDHT